MRSAADRPGRFVVVVGPDGVGKTTIARALLDHWAGPTAYVHFAPPIWAALPQRPAPDPMPVGDKEPGRGAPLLGCLRLARNLARFWCGYLARVRPNLARGTLVVGDRWGYGYVGQPGALRYGGPRSLARLAVRLLPQPDLVINLTASARTVVARKAELDESAVRSELRRWATLPVRRVWTVDAEAAPAVIVHRILERLRVGGR